MSATIVFVNVRQKSDPNTKGAAAKITSENRQALNQWLAQLQAQPHIALGPASEGSRVVVGEGPTFWLGGESLFHAEWEEAPSRISGPQDLALDISPGVIHDQVAEIRKGILDGAIPEHDLAPPCRDGNGR